MKKFVKSHTHHQEEVERGYAGSHKAGKGGKKSKRAMHGHFEKQHVWPITNEKVSGRRKV